MMRSGSGVVGGWAWAWVWWAMVGRAAAADPVSTLGPMSGAGLGLAMAAVLLSWALVAVWFAVHRHHLPPEEQLNELPAVVAGLQKMLGSAKFKDRYVLDWAQRADLPETFWDDYNFLYGEMERCPEERTELFDFWAWRTLLAGEGGQTGVAGRRATTEGGTPKEPPAEQLFDLALVLGFANLVLIGLGGKAELRADEDPRYDTLKIGRTEQILPREGRHRRHRPLNQRTRKNRQPTTLKDDTVYQHQTTDQNMDTGKDLSREERSSEKKQPAAGTEERTEEGRSRSAAGPGTEEPRSGATAASLATAEEDGRLALANLDTPSRSLSDHHTQ